MYRWAIRIAPGRFGSRSCHERVRQEGRVLGSAPRGNQGLQLVRLGLAIALLMFAAACTAAPPVSAPVSTQVPVSLTPQPKPAPAVASPSSSAPPSSAQPAAKPPSSPAAVASPSAVAAVQPTPVPRTGNDADLILATTTSTQDSGLLDVLIPLFQQQTGYQVKTVSVGTGAALALGARGEADVVLVHAPDSEVQWMAQGNGTARRLVMHNDFVIVGPAADPARIKGETDALVALRKIADGKVPFVSRGDNSGTQQLELSLWQKINIAPRGQPWYIESGTGMGQ